MRGQGDVLQEGVAERLAAGGHAPGAIAALLDLDRALFAFHGALARGEALAGILAGLGSDLELAEFRALAAVARITHGLGRAAPEAATVGALAGELGLDPSRASRLAAQLVARGALRREAAQGDARKTILVATAGGRALLRAVRDRKWQDYEAVFRHWSEAEIVAFAGLLGRFLRDGGLSGGAAPGGGASGGVHGTD